ncbi:MAG: phosphate acyltransferase PlsX [Syntrophobacteraceae bacterium]|nr:phosphate acyltransferase PlsX [Desulfobacteraceae bacterium]
MKIAVDAMGGDNAPEAPVRGALLAKPQCQADLLLIGNEIQLRTVLGHTDENAGIEVLHAPEIIGMGEAGPTAIRKKREASLSVAMRLLGEGEVDAVVSAGNSSAVVATAKHFVGLVPGLRRPSMAVSLPGYAGRVLLLDAGANAESDTIHLVQSAALAHAFLKVSEGLDSPRLGLLNIGQEPIKGMRVIQRAFALLQRSHLRFIGNVEPTELFSDRTDAAICDGFVGNVLLKTYEGLSEKLIRFFEAHSGEWSEPLRDEMQQLLQAYNRTHHYQNVGGAPLLGTRKTVVVAHGRSQGRAIANAIHLASRLAGEEVFRRMSDQLMEGGILAELKHLSTIMMLESLKTRWGFTQK